MFGIAVARLDQVDDAERARYEELYCGVCRSLKARYGQISRAALSYDLAFLAMLLDSLHEYPNERASMRCISHPAKEMPSATSPATEFAADMSVMFAYHKCLDDIADDASLRGRAGSKLLANAYQRCRARYPELCAECEASMARIREIETAAQTEPDEAAREFGSLLGNVFAYTGGIFEQTMRELGQALGVFVYMMDAAIDLRADIRNNSYNPFKGLDMDADAMQVVLTELAGDVAHAFEKLPLEQDIHLMRSVIYAGMWQKFNQTYRKEATVRRDVDDRESI